MYPSETSLIPVTVALIRFFEVQGLEAFLLKYPFWYLSSTPYRYLIGPVVPTLSFLVHKFVPAVTLFNITIITIIATYLAGVFGWVLLVYVIDAQRFRFRHFIFLALLIIFPWRIFSSLTLDEGSLTVARNFLPFCLFFYWKLLTVRGLKYQALTVFFTAVLLLINTSILPMLLIGVVALCLASSFKSARVKGFVKAVRLALPIIIFSLILVTFWYTPGYWVTILFNPSIGGVSTIKILLRIVDLLKAFVPIVMAIWSVYYWKKNENSLTLFSFVWVMVFAFLAIFRFIGDPDFWMDWTGWFYELEIGIALLFSNIHFSIFNFGRHTAKYILLATLLLFPFYITWRIYIALRKPAILSDQVPVSVRSLDKLAESAGNKFIFLSGSTVFWANALYDIYQVRGGRDHVAVNPYWDKVAWEFREGRDPEKSRVWIEALGISYVLVHTSKSDEYYHDFQNVNKWHDLGSVMLEKDGDLIYKLSN